MMYLNRLLNRRQIVELNDLDAEEEADVFALLRPFQGAGEAAVFLEVQADRVIEVVRLQGKSAGAPACRPPADQIDSPQNRPPPNVRRCVEEHHLKEEDMGNVTQTSWAESVDHQELKAPAMLIEPLLIDEKGAGVMLGVSRRKVFDLNKQGVLRSMLIGKRKLYSVADLRAFANGEVI